MGLSIIPIKVGNEKWPKSYFMGPGSGEELIDIPHMMFYIDGAPKKILVDTGGSDPQSENTRKFHSKTYTRTLDEEPSRALKLATGFTPEQIEIVILSHLHWDHACNCHLFPNATFYVQMKEIIDTINPIPRFSKTYEAFNIGTVPPWAQQGVRWAFLDGDAEILPGIDVIMIPGHSAGIQGILVKTDKGQFFLGSDAFPLYDNILADGTVLPGTLNLSLEQAYYSSVKVTKLVKEHGATVIPGHDQAVLKYRRYPAG
jgi:glyoxylase-like metal-dependent hydrolase (beta-lactamase superfamily II)